MMSGENVVSALWKRQVCANCFKNELISDRILRNTILAPRSKFTPVWSKGSHKHICMGLDRRIYFDNHHSCYYTDGFGGEPALIYKLDNRVFKPDSQHKILCVLLYHCYTPGHDTLPEEKVVCLLVLTADGFLKILNADTGAILRSIFLSTAIKYRYLLWASYLKTVQIKSTQSKPTSASSSRRGVPNNRRVMTIAVFQIHPLELMTCLPIETNIFGEDVSDAFVNDDLLVVSHKSGTIKMYSLPWIVKNCTVVDASLGSFVELPRGRGSEIRAGAVGNPGFGVPCTVQLAECPPCLFSTKSYKGMGVSFGGHPTVFLSQASSGQDKFLLTSLQTRKQISVLKSKVSAFHSDVAEFHFDDHHRVIHISGCSLSCHRLTYDARREKQEMQREYTIDFRKLSDSRPDCLPQYSSYGRAIRRQNSMDYSEDIYTSAVQDVDYENETDLLYAVVTLPDSSSEANMQCNLYFIDEKSGSIIKTVPLPTWEPDGNNSIYYELDCILHLFQSDTSSTSTLHYYRLGY